MKRSLSVVIPNLWMGGDPPKDPRIAQLFDVIVLCAKECQDNHAESDYGNRVRFVRAPLNDSSMTTTDESIVRAAAWQAAQLLRRGARVLIVCAMGLNRSGVVTARTIMFANRGVSADRAIELVRNARGPNALFNKHFVRFLQHEDRLGRTAKAV